MNSKLYLTLLNHIKKYELCKWFCDQDIRFYDYIFVRRLSKSEEIDYSILESKEFNGIWFKQPNIIENLIKIRNNEVLQLAWDQGYMFTFSDIAYAEKTVNNDIAAWMRALILNS